MCFPMGRRRPVIAISSNRIRYPSPRAANPCPTFWSAAHPREQSTPRVDSPAATAGTLLAVEHDGHVAIALSRGDLHFTRERFAIGGKGHSVRKFQAHTFHIGRGNDVLPFPDRRTHRGITVEFEC